MVIFVARSLSHVVRGQDAVKAAIKDWEQKRVELCARQEIVQAAIETWQKKSATITWP